MEDGNQSAIPSSKPTMDQLEKESGITWEDALVRLKGLETSLKHQIQTDIREMKLCMSSNKIEDVSLKAARLHDIRRTLASSRALVREECAIMKEFEKIKGILGDSRTMDEDDWSSTKDQTRYWGDKLAEVRRRQRRVSGDVEGLDGVVSDIISRGSMKSDSMDSLDNLSFHLTNYPLFNNAPYGHHLSVPSRPGSAMSDVSAVSTGIAGYFKGRDTTTDFSQSEAESSITPQTQRKKLFTRTSKKEPSIDGSECEESQYSMQEIYLMEKRKSTKEFKRKAMSEKEANIKALGDHEEALSEYENYEDEEEYFSIQDRLPAEQIKIESCNEELGLKEEKELNSEIGKNQDELEPKIKEENERIEALRLKEEEQFIKIEAAQKLKAEEEEMMRIESQRLNDEQKEKEKIEAQKKKEAEEKQNKVEEKRRKEGEKKKKLEEKTQKEEEKKRKMQLKQKKEEEKKMKLELKQKKEEEMENTLEKKQEKMEEKEKLRLITESKKMEEEEESKLEIKEENLKEKEKLLIQEQQKIEEVNEGDQSRNEIDQKGKMDLKEDNTKGSEVVKPKRSKSRELKEKRATEREYSQSRSQSQDRKSTHSNQDEVFAVPEKNETDEEDVTQSTKEPFILNKKTTKSRSQSQDRKLVQPKQEEASPESIQMDEENNPKSFDGQSKPKKNPIKSRSHSRDRKYEPSNKEEAPVESTQIEMDEVNATQSTQEQSKTKIKPTKSQSRDWKSVQSKLEEPSFESTQIEINEDDITQSFEELSIAKKKTIQSPPQSQDRKSVPSNKEEVLFQSTQIDMNEVDVKQSTKEPSLAKKKKIKSRSQSRDRKFSQTKQKEVPANSTQIETGEVDVIPLKEVLADQQNGKMTKQGSIINKEFKTLKSQPQSRENSIKQPENKNDLLEDNGNTLFPNENRATAIESSQKPEDPSKTKIIKSRSQSREKKSIGVEELKTGLSTKQVEYNNENNIEASLVENELGDGCQVANPRRSKGKLAEKPTLSYVDPENQDQELQTEGFSKLQTVKSRSQSREKKYIAIEEDDISLSTKQAENNNENDIEASQVENELGDGSQVAKPRRSKGKLAKQPTLSYGDPENQDQELQTEGFSKLQSAKSRSQSREKKYIAIQEDNISLSTKQAKYNNEASEVEHELSDLPQVAKPRRRKGKSAEHPTLSSCETKNEEQRIITEGDSKSQSVKSRSQSREKKSIAIEEDDISLSTKQAEYNNENDFQASHVRNELDDGPQIPKPRRSKGKLGKQPTVSTETSENINQSQFIESNSQRMDIVQMESLYPKGAYVEDGSYNEGQEGTKFCNSPRSISRDRSQIYAEEAESELLKEQFFEVFEIEDLTLTNTQVVKPRRSKVTNKKSAEPPENCDKSRSTSRNMNPLSIRDVFVISLDKDNECDTNIILNSNFKQGSPEYAEIDYEQDQLMTGEKNLGQYGMEEQIMATTNVECQYATVQKKKKGSRNGSQDRQDDSNAPIQEPIYAEVQKKTSSRPTSLDRNNSREEGLQESSFRTSSMDQRSFQDSTSSSRQASRERKNSEGQRSLSGERGNITEFESKCKTPSSESLKKPVRSSRMKNNEELNLNDSNSENICNVFESMGKIKSDFLGHEDQHESSSELPDMVPIKKPERSSRKHVLDIGYLKEDEYPLEIVHTGTKPSLKGQKYSINNQDSLDFEEFEDTNEYLQDIDYELRSAELAEEEELNSLRRTKEIKSYLTPRNSDTRDNLYIDEEMERPLSALGTYSADDEPEDSVDDLISYRERNFIREKPDGMDKEELRQFDPRAFQQRKRQKSGLLSPDSSFEDEEYFHNLNQGLKSGKKEPENTQSRLTQSRNLTRERPMKLDLSDLKPRLGEKVKGNFYQDEALMDELDLRNSLNQMWNKEPGRRRRTVSHSFQSEDNDYIVGDDVVEFDSGVNNYPFLKPPSEEEQIPFCLCISLTERKRKHWT
ncbi:uncharacterized protein [Lepeophtheirus salmonis]|uniref:uncharacterized protein n=1 Tax=Lepeophtheirus salmonis TaxID=72036 RepID=UPI001AEB5D36|nr:trichohyalin-like [Lepeophtheirus salmonis]